MNKIIVNTLHVFMVLAVTAIILLTSNHYANAAEIPDTYTNENFWNSEQDRPAIFVPDRNGNFYGFTMSGKYFTQRNISNDRGIPMQRFSIDQAFFYITDRGIILADNNLAAISIYLNRKA